MNPFKNSKSAPEENLHTAEVLIATEVSDGALDAETNLFPEVAKFKDSASENKAQGKVKV
jgi:hypothetical protein